MRPTSRIAGFYARLLAERVAHVQPTLSPQAGAWLARGGGLDVATADRMSENVIGTR